MARLREQHVTDLVTEDGELVRITQQRDPAKTYQRGPFVIVFTEAMARAGEQIKQAGTLRVLHLLPEYLNFMDFRQLPTAKLGERLGMNTGNVSRAMAQLVGLNIVEKEGKGPRTAWRLTTDWGWNGTVDQFHAFNNGRLKGKKPPIRATTASSRIMHISGTASSTCSPENTVSNDAKLGVGKQTKMRLLRVEKGTAAT